MVIKLTAPVGIRLRSAEDQATWKSAWSGGGAYEDMFLMDWQLIAARESHFPLSIWLLLACPSSSWFSYIHAQIGNTDWTQWAIRNRIKRRGIWEEDGLGESSRCWTEEMGGGNVHISLYRGKKFSNNTFFQNKKSDLKDGSAVKRSYFSGKGPWFTSTGLQPPIIPKSGDLLSSSGHQENLHACGPCKLRQGYAHANR